MGRSSLDHEPVLAGTEADAGMNAVPLLRSGERQCRGSLAGAPDRAATEQLTHRANPFWCFAQVESRTSNPVGQACHAMGDRVGELAAGTEPERKVHPSVADPEQDGGGQPVRLL